MLDARRGRARRDQPQPAWAASLTWLGSMKPIAGTPGWATWFVVSWSRPAPVRILDLDAMSSCSLALLLLIERSRTGSPPRAEVARRLAPAVGHLFHLRMTAARLPQPLLIVWEGIERWPRLTRQYLATVDRIRDRIAASTARYSAATQLRARSI